MGQKFAIFDMDGTLVDSMSWWNDLAGEFLRDRGLPSPTPAQQEAMKTMSMAESSAYVVNQFGLDCQPQEAAADMSRRMAEHYRQDVKCKPGVQNYLERLRAAGVPCCVASATDRPLVEACLTRLGIRSFFQFVLSCGEVGAGKDRPDVYQEAARRLGAAPAEAAVYEDALCAARTAKEAGFFVVGVYDENSRDTWAELCAAADAHITDFQAAEPELLG